MDNSRLTSTEFDWALLPHPHGTQSLVVLGPGGILVIIQSSPLSYDEAAKIYRRLHSWVVMKRGLIQGKEFPVNELCGIKPRYVSELSLSVLSDSLVSSFVPKQQSIS